MARLSDYGIQVDELSNVNEVVVQGTKFPIALSMETLEYIADVYDGNYEQWEFDMKSMLKKSDGRLDTRNLSPGDLKIMRALVYGMLRTGGLEETPDTIFKFLGLSGDVLTAYGACMEIFSQQTFQVEDLKKSKTPQDFQPTKRKRNRKRNKKGNPGKN